MTFAACHRALVFALLTPALAIGCAATPPAGSSQRVVVPPPAPTPAAPQPTASTAVPAPGELPPMLRDLDYTPAQLKEVLRIRADLEREATTFRSAAEELGHSVAGAARQCKGTTPFMESDAARLVREGEELRGPVLDAIQRVHGLLTPAQRQKLSARLVEGDDWAKRERRNSQRTRDLGPALDLGNMQVMQMLVKAAVLWSSFAERADPWRVKYRTAITNFAREDFDVRKEPAASVPVIALVVEFVREGLRALLPILDPKQCEALGALIDQRVDEEAAKAAARARAAEQP